MTKKSVSILGSFLLMVAALVIAAPAHAEEFADKIPDLVWLDVGGTFSEVTTTAGLTGPNGVGLAIDFEEIFDLPGSKTNFQIQGTARISEKRRHMDFGYVNIKRSGTDVIDQDITWGDFTLIANANVTAKFNTEFIYAAFRYDFLHEEKVRISGSAGLSYVNLGTGLDWTGDYIPPGGTTPITGSESRSSSVAIPVPLIGFNIDWAIAKGLVFRSYNRFFQLNFSGIDGGLYESGVHLNWYFIRNLGIGLGYDRTQLKLNSYETGDNVLRADYTIGGWGLYATMAF